MKRALPAILIAAAFLAVGWVPATSADTPIANLALGSSLSSDFNDGAQGWAASDVPPPAPRPDATPTWEWGAPTSGPNAASSGVNAWATNLEGLYGANECAGLATPPIDLTAATSASIAYDHWRHMDQFSATSSFVSDVGVLLATTDGGATFTQLTAPDYTSNSISSVTRPCLDGAGTDLRGYTGPHGTTIPAPTYATSSVDLSAFAGQTVQVVFTFASNCCTHRSGWYLDDVATTVDGVTTIEDFEVDNGGFTMIGTKVPPPSPQGWEQGVATVGPAAESALFATNLEGDYGPNECAWIESEPFLVGPVEVDASAVATATLSWMQWYRSSSFSAAGVVQIGTSDGYSIVSPVGGYPDTSTTSALLDCLGADAAETGTFSGFVDSLGSQMVEQQADLTPWVGQTVTLRFLFASTTSTTTYEGWYVDDVNVDVSLDLSAPDAEDVVPGLGSGANAPGWTSGGELTTWAYGVAAGAGPEGETVYGTNLAGSYSNRECGWIETPAIPGAIVALDPTLTFEEWHEIESVSSTTTSYDGGVVIVSADDGATWTPLAGDGFTRAPLSTLNACLTSLGLASGTNVLAGRSEEWTPMTMSLSEFADASTLRIRFVFGSDGSVVYDGWYLKNVAIGGVKVL